jgi:integrase
MTTKVTLRQKPISKERKSLYLDFYPAIPHHETGQPTRREFLGLYLFSKEKNPIDKQHNKETLQLAQQIRQKRENHLNKPEIYTGYEKEQLRIKEQGQQNFVEYFKTLANKRKASNHDNWVSAYNYLETFTKGNLKFADLNERFCNEFKEYLLTTGRHSAKSNKSSKATLSQNSAASYFSKIKATLKQAYKDGYLQTDLNAKIEPVKQAETQRNFLTIEELNSLVKTECNNPLLKRAALFSALTGLRHGDIKKLVWSQLEYIKNNGYFIQFTQQKSKGVEMMPISEQAYSLLGEPKKPTDKVFEGLTYSAYQNKHFAKWIGLAGISKKITFHCLRHTFATLQLSKRPDGSAGTDFYTVSKMMGHRDLKTTQIYAKIIDQTKRDAADKIQLDL